MVKAERMSFFKKIFRGIGKVARVISPIASFIPGPIGSIARAVAPLASGSGVAAPQSAYTTAPSPVFGSGYTTNIAPVFTGPAIATGARAIGYAAGRALGYTVAAWRRLSPAQRAAIVAAGTVAAPSVFGGADGAPSAPRARARSTRRRRRVCKPKPAACRPKRRRTAKCRPKRVSFCTKSGRKVSFLRR